MGRGEAQPQHHWDPGQTPLPLFLYPLHCQMTGLGLNGGSHDGRALKAPGDRDLPRPETHSGGWGLVFLPTAQGSGTLQPGSTKKVTKCPLRWLLESQKSPDKALNSEC